jgi:hypothetical protein
VNFLLSFVRQLVSILVTLSRYSAVSLSGGGLGVLLAWLLGQPQEKWYWAFFVGFCLPVGPLYWYTSRHSYVERLLVELRAWRNRNLIDHEAFERASRMVLESFLTRRGIRPPSPEQGAPRTVLPTAEAEPAEPPQEPGGEGGFDGAEGGLPTS